MKKLLVAALMVVLASPAFAAIQNVKVSGDITSTYVDRNDFDLGSVSGTAQDEGLKSQSIFLTQTRLRVDADLSDNVSTTVGLINERVWNGENASNPSGSNANYANDTNVQLYLASVTMREFLYSPLSLTVGRQIFTYGNGLVIGNGLPNQATGNLQFIAQDLTMRTSEDGVRAVLDYKPLTIDLIYFKNAVNNNAISGFYGSYNDNSDVYGINANYQLSDPMNTVAEAYFFSRLNGNVYTAGNSITGTNLTGTGLGPVSNKADDTYVPGLRASTNPVKGLNVQGEFAWELGQHPVVYATGAQQAQHRDAMAAQFMASYALPVLDKYKPTVNGSYTYVSGDKNSYYSGSTTNPNPQKSYSAWDPMFEGQGAGTIWNTLFPLTNMNILSAGASVNPLEDVTLAATWSDLWAAESFSANNPLAIYQPNDGANFLPVDYKAGARGLGNEFDVNLTYNYTEDVTFGVNVGWFVTGSAFEGVTTSNNGLSNKSNASQALADVAVKF